MDSLWTDGFRRVTACNSRLHVAAYCNVSKTGEFRVQRVLGMLVIQALDTISRRLEILRLGEGHSDDSRLLGWTWVRSLHVLAVELLPGTGQQST